jgi:hypothetical protein
VDPKTAVSIKQKTEKKKAKIIASVDKKQEPDVPIKRPKRIHEIKLRNGKSRIQRYIKQNSKFKFILSKKFKIKLERQRLQNNRFTCY